MEVERIEDKSKALSYIGIEIAEALKYIPAPAEEVLSGNSVEEASIVSNLEDNEEESFVESAIQGNGEKKFGENFGGGNFDEEMDNYFEETRFETKPSLWQRFKNSKFVRTIRYIMQIRVVLDYPALPEGRDEY